MTTVALPKIPAGSETNTLSSIASLLGAVGKMTGSGKETTKSTMDPNTAAMMQQLMQSIGGTANSDSIDGIIQDIFNKAKPAIGAPLFTTAGAGAYNSKSQAQMSTAPFAAAVAASSKAKLDGMQNGQDMMARLLQGSMGANRTQVTSTGASPLGSMLGPAALALSAYSKLRGPQAKKGESKTSGTGAVTAGKELLGTAPEAGIDLGLLDGTDPTGGLAGLLSSGFGTSAGASAGSDFSGLASMLGNNSGILADSNFLGGAADLFSNFGGGTDLFNMFDLTDTAGMALDAASGAGMAFDALSLTDPVGGLLDAGGWGLNFGFPGAGTLLSAVLKGGNPIENVGESVVGLFETVGSFFGDLFGW